MKDSEPLGKGSKLLVSKEIMKSVAISNEQLQHHITELKLILGTKFELVIPSKINDAATLWWIINLSQCLQKLKQCEGFERHVGRYTRRQIHSSYLVTVIASSLLEKADNIILEPPILGKLKRSDILATFRGEQVYLECKHMDVPKFHHSGEHEHMFSVLSDYIDMPHQISITYKRTFLDTELHRLGETL